MRCPSCSKFPSFDIADPELELTDAERGVVTGSVRLVLNSQCCGEECKEHTFDVELDLGDAIEDALKEAGVENPDLEAEGVEFEIKNESADGFDRYEDKDRHGKRIKSARYMKHMYGVEMEVTVKCSYPKGDETVEVSVDGTWKDEVAGSEMEEL